MKKLLFALFVTCAALSSLAVAMDLPDVGKFASCGYCGMDRGKFAASRMLITYNDGAEAGLCSLHCAAVDLANQLDKMPDAIQVADYNSKTLMNAEEAAWVVGGDEKGVMTKRAKWAFAAKADAESFVTAHGGEVVDFEKAVKAAYEDMYQDTLMIRNKRREMREMKMKEGAGAMGHGK